MLDQLEHLFEGVAWTSVALGVVGAGAVGFLAYEHGWPWVKAKFQAIWGKTQALEERIVNLVHVSTEDVHVRVDELVTRVEALETKTAGISVVAPTPVGTLSPAVTGQAVA